MVDHAEATASGECPYLVVLLLLLQLLVSLGVRATWSRHWGKLFLVVAQGVHSAVEEDTETLCRGPTRHT